MIAIGSKLPHAKVQTMSNDGPVTHDAVELLGKGKVVLFAVPGAFTPTCSKAHLPGFVVNADAIKAHVDVVACLSVNDAFVMHAWGNANNAEHIMMVADGNAELTHALGLEMDGSGFGMGTRSKRFAMLIENGVITRLDVEQPREFKVSSAEAVLSWF